MFAPVAATCLYSEYVVTDELRWLLIGFAIGVFVVTIIVSMLILVLGEKADKETKTQIDEQHTQDGNA